MCAMTPNISVTMLQAANQTQASVSSVRILRSIGLYRRRQAITSKYSTSYSTAILTAMKGSLFPTTTWFFSWLIMGDPVLVRPLCLRETLGTLVRNSNSRSKFEIPLFIVTVYHVVIMLFV